MISVWLVAVALAQVPVVNAPADADVTTLTRLETDWNAAHVRGDAAALEHLFADDVVVMVPGMRVMTKADAVGMFTSGRMKFDRYETSETTVPRLRRDCDRHRPPPAHASARWCDRRRRLEVHEGLPPSRGPLAGRLVSRVEHRALNLNAPVDFRHGLAR